MPNRETPDPYEHPEWPPLLAQMLKDKHCFQCKVKLQPDAIVGLGGQMILARDGPYHGPAPFMILLCPCCHLVQTRVAPVPQAVMVEAMAQLYAWGEHLAKRHGTQLGETFNVSDAIMEPQDGEFSRDVPMEPRWVRPSIRRWQPRHPFSEMEVLLFLQKLGNTSFRVGTKSFRRFLGKMGIDPDKPVDDDTDPEVPPF